MTIVKKSLCSVVVTAALLFTPAAAFADTAYDVPVTLQQAVNPDKASMAAGALKPVARVVEDGSKTVYTVSLKPMQLQGLNGNVTNLFILADKQRVEATKSAIQDGDYNTAMRFERATEKERDIPIAVWVDVMDELQGGAPGAGEQDAILRFDWDKAKEVAGEKEPANEKPASQGSQPQGSAPIQVFVDGKAVAYDSQPIIQNGRTLVPLRATFEALGADVSWDDKTRTVKAEKDGRSLSLTIDSKNAVVDGSATTLDEPAMIQNGRTLVPLRFIGEAFGNHVDYRLVNGIAVIDIAK